MSDQGRGRTSRRRHLVTLAAVLLTIPGTVAAAAGPTQAVPIMGTLTISSGVLSYSANPGVADNVATFAEPTMPGWLRVADSGGIVAYNSASTSCRPFTDHRSVVCQLAAVNTVNITLGDGNDTAGSGGNTPVAKPFVINGGPGNDGISGADGADLLYGGDGSDALAGGAGNDYLQGGTWADQLRGGAGLDTISYRDHLQAVRVRLPSSGKEMWGGSEDQGDTGTDIENVVGGAGDDALIGDGNANQLDGREGNDRLSGYEGNDNLIGWTGNDTLNGDAGNDRLAGGPGSDSLDHEPPRRAGADQLLGNGEAATAGPDGADTIDAQDGTADTVIDCGVEAPGSAEADRVPTYDQADRAVIRNCGPTLNRYNGGEHWETTGPVPAGYRFEVFLGNLSDVQQTGMVALLGCLAGTDHFLDTSCGTATTVRTEGYLYNARLPQPASTTPLYACAMTAGGEHFASNSATCEGRRATALLGYTMPKR